MGLIGGWSIIRKKHPLLRIAVDDVAVVDVALGFLPTEFMIDGCVILVIIWKRERYGSVYALAAASELGQLAVKVAQDMLSYLADFIDTSVPWNWYFDGPDREGKKKRHDPAKVAEHINIALRLYYLCCSHGAKGQAREILNKWVTPDTHFIEEVAHNISVLLAARQGGKSEMCKGEADYPMAQLLTPSTAVVTSDSDSWGFTNARALVVPQKK